ncbi:MAG: hypothetical protein QXI58_07270 [Candidatus Micrarchaeia archaeon]
MKEKDVIKIVEEAIKKGEAIDERLWMEYVDLMKNKSDVEIFTEEEKQRKEIKTLKECEYYEGEVIGIRIVNTKYGERLLIEFKDCIIFLPNRYSWIKDKAIGKVLTIYRLSDMVMKNKRGRKYIKSRYQFLIK